MRVPSVVLLTALLSVSLASTSPSAPPPGEKGAQYDRFGRLVYSPSKGRIEYDDRDGGPAPISNAAAAPDLSTASLAAAAPDAPNLENASASGTSLVLKRDWHRIAFGTDIGAAGLRVADIDADGQNEIVAGAWPGGYEGNKSVYVLSRQGDDYTHEWSSLPVAHPQQIASVRVAQADADTALEVLVGVANRIEIYDGTTHALEKTVTTTAAAIDGLALADVDADGSLELVFLDAQRLYVYGLATGALEFQGSGMGGTDLEVGQADADPALEIAIANESAAGLLVDGETRAVQWSEPSGFGRYVRLADFDGDGVVELVATRAYGGVRVYDTTSHALVYEVQLESLEAVSVADVEGDGTLEIVYGDTQWGGVHVLDGATGSQKWEVDNPEHGVTEIAVGDVDGDGTPEILFGAGQSSSGPDHLYVVDTESRTIVWESLDEAGPHYGFAFGDVDADGEVELVHTSLESDSGYADGLVFVHDAATKALEHRSGPVSATNYTGVWRVRAANVDADPQLELLVSSGSGYQGAVYCLDGLSHEVQWQASVDNGLAVRSLQAADLEGDGSLEVIAGVYQEHTGAPGHFLYVFDAHTGSLEWRLPIASAWAQSSLLRIANVDGDSPLEIVLARHRGALWIVDGETRAVELALPDTLYATALETVDRDGDGRAEILVGTDQGRIQVVDPATGALQEIGSFGAAVNGLAVVDLTQDGTEDLAFCTADRLRVVDGASGVVAAATEFLGTGACAHDSVAADDVDGDGVIELVANQGVYGLIVFEAAQIPDTQAPVVSLASLPPGPLSGTHLLQAQASDDRGVARVEFYLDAALLGADAGEPYSFSWATATATPGSHVLSARAFDAAGNVGTSAGVPVLVLDQSAPSAQITQPTNGSVLSGAAAVSASASDNVGVVRVELLVDSILRATDLEPPYSFVWDTTTTANGSHVLHARAYDAAGNATSSAPVSVSVSNPIPGGAVYDAALRAPRCLAVGSACDSGTLLVGRGLLGPEPHQPNTVGASCPDQNSGTFHVSPSNDRLVVATLDGSPLAAGKTVRVSASVWAEAGFYASNHLDIYSSAQATSPVWVHRGTLSATAAGPQVLSTTFVLPAGAHQVVRARFRFMGSASACGMGSNDDHDDLVFAVDSGSSTPPSVSIDAPTNGATVAFTVDVQATASSPVGVARVEFYVDGQLRHSDTAPPWLFSWDTTSATNGTHTLLARAYDVASNTGQSLPVSVNVQNALLGQAVFDPTLRVPACALPGSVCDSGTLLVGRGTLGPEPNRPNTIRGSCGDDNTGSFHLDESNDRLRVVSVDGTPIGPGKTIRIEATVWAWASAGDYLDLYHAVDAMNPAWTRITTLPATKKGSQLLSATLVLPASSQPGAGLQAVRARFRYQGSASACAVGYYTDHDDLVFAAN